jgi:hypothetical protein
MGPDHYVGTPNRSSRYRARFVAEGLIEVPTGGRCFIDKRKLGAPRNFFCLGAVVMGGDPPAVEETICHHQFRRYISSHSDQLHLTMSVPRLLSRGRCLFSLTTPSIRVAVAATPRITTSVSARGFTASGCSREDVVQTPSRGPEIALTDARAPTTPAGSSTAVAILKMPKRMTRREVEQMLHSKGCTMYVMQRVICS